MAGISMVKNSGCLSIVKNETQKYLKAAFTTLLYRMHRPNVAMVVY